MAGVVVLIGLGLLFAGVRWIMEANRKLQAFRKYEFENRNAAGVAFDTYEASQDHEAGKRGARMLGNFAGFVLIVGLITSMAGCRMFFDSDF
jgi:hypothetical protein